MLETVKDRNKKKVSLFLYEDSYKAFKDFVKEINDEHPDYANISISKFQNMAMSEIMDHPDIESLLKKYNFLHLKENTASKNGSDAA